MVQPSKALRVAAVAALGLLASSPVSNAWAAGTLGDRFQELATEIQKLGGPLAMILYALAIIFFIAFVMAMFSLSRPNRGGASPATAIFTLFAAVCCVCMPTLLGMGSQTLTGAAPTITGSSTSPVIFQ